MPHKALKSDPLSPPRPPARPPIMRGGTRIRPGMGFAATAVVALLFVGGFGGVAAAEGSVDASNVILEVRGTLTGPDCNGTGLHP